MFSLFFGEGQPSHINYFSPKGAIKQLRVTHTAISYTRWSLIMRWRGPSCREVDKVGPDPGPRLVLLPRLWRACLEVGCAPSGPRCSLITLTRLLQGWQLWRREERDRTRDEAHLGSPLVPSQDNHFLSIFFFSFPREQHRSLLPFHLLDVVCQNAWGPPHTDLFPFLIHSIIDNILEWKYNSEAAPFFFLLDHQ